MFLLRQLPLIKMACGHNSKQVAGMKFFPPPIKYENIEKYERPKLRVVDKVPVHPPNIKPPKMQKCLRFMRGPELVHNTLLHKQYGIIATGGGRMRYGFFEMIRLKIARSIDTNRMFAIWRVPPPWQPITKKGQGQVGGNIEFEEVKDLLTGIVKKFPFKAKVVSQAMMEEIAAEEARLEEENINPFTKKYVIQNNLSGCHKRLSPNDHKYFGKYL